MVSKKFRLEGIKVGETDKVPCRDRIVTFIHITADGLVRGDKTVTGKYEIMDNFKKVDLLLGAWTGRYTTDIFELAPKLVAKQFK